MCKITAVINLGVSIDGSTEAAPLETENKLLKIPPGHSLPLHLHFVVPRGTSAGNYHPFVTISQDGSSTTAIGQAQFTIV